MNGTIIGHWQISGHGSMLITKIKTTRYWKESRANTATTLRDQSATHAVVTTNTFTCIIIRLVREKGKKKAEHARKKYFIIELRQYVEVGTVYLLDIEWLCGEQKNIYIMMDGRSIHKGPYYKLSPP